MAGELESDFPVWFENFIDNHPVARHTAYFDFLANKVSESDIRFYLGREPAIDASTDDFLASLQIGAPISAKSEIAAKCWDEMGDGDPSLLHLKLFEAALASFSVEESKISDALTIDALICGNLQTMLSLHRTHFYKGVGYFSATEQLIPDRFRALHTGWERNGLSDLGARYHLLHIDVDCDHTQSLVSKHYCPIGRKQYKTW